MMKTKKLFLLLVMLLMNLGSFAQNNNPIQGDVNGDGKVDVADIVAIIDIMKNGGGTSGETKYYWYGGPDMLTSSTVPGSGTVYPMTATNENQIGWHRIDGKPDYIETGDLNYGEKINWVLAIPTILGLNHISNGEDVTDAYDVTTITCADGVEYTVFTQISSSKKTSRAFVDGKTKYYWYFGTTLPTEANLANVATGSSDIVESWDGVRWKLQNYTEETSDIYICVPVKFNIIWKDADGNVVNLIDVNTFTIDSIEYKVQKWGSPLGAGEKLYIYAHH